MRHPNNGLLLAYLEDQANPKQKKNLRIHIERCEVCRARLERLKDERQRVSGALDALSPGPLDQPDQRRALAALKSTVNGRDKLTMFEKIRTNKTAQRVLSAVAGIAVLVGLFSLAPVRALASDFLSLLRVDSFTVVDVDPERIEELAEVMEDQDVLFGEQEILDDVEAPVEVGTIGEAADMVDFVVRKPLDYGEPDRVTVSDAGAVRIRPDVELMREVLLAVGLDPELVPEEVDGEPFDITIPESVTMIYGDGNPDEYGEFSLMQMPSPTAEVPDGVDMDALGEAMLIVLGMDSDEAARMSRRIDWTSTLVIPMPVGYGSAEDVEVDGTSGLLLEAEPMEEGGESGCGLLWQRGGILYMVSGPANNCAFVKVVAGSLN
jgi:hypothetical protein